MKLLLLILLATLSLSAEDTLRPRYGAYVSSWLTLHKTDFNSLPNSNCCGPNYTGTNNIDFEVGGLYYIPINSKTSMLGINVAYRTISPSFKSTKEEPISDGVNSIRGIIEYPLDVQIGSLDLGLSYNYKFIEKTFAIGGLRFGTLLNKSFTQSEILVSPTDRGHFFENGKRIRNENSGAIEGLSAFNFGFDIGASRDFSLNKENTNLLNLSLIYNMQINSLSDKPWNISGISLKLAYHNSPYERIKYKYEKINERIDTITIISNKYNRDLYKMGELNSLENTIINGDTTIKIIDKYRRDTIYIAEFKPKPLDIPAEPLPIETKHTVDAKLNLDFYQGETLLQTPTKEIKVNVNIAQDIYPSLTYIFFEENQSEIPQRYEILNDLSSFIPTSLSPSPIVYHRNILNIIAKRLLENPDAKLKIKGYIDPTTESDCRLALERATAVQNTLILNHKVSKEQLEIVADATNCFPKDITKSQTSEGYAENRRVELETDEPEKIFSVNNSKYENPTVIMPSKIIINAEAKAFLQKDEKKDEEEITNWTLTAEQEGGITFQEKTGSGNNASITLEINRNNAKLLSNNKVIKVNFNAGNEYASKSVTKEIKVIKDTNEIEAQSFTLTPFQVNQFTLDSKVKKEIRTFLKNADANSVIAIRAYSDKLGQYEKNKELSQIRANEVRDYVKSIIPNAKIVEVKAIASDKNAPGINAYDTPEERFLSRTVEIEIKKSNK